MRMIVAMAALLAFSACRPAAEEPNRAPTSSTNASRTPSGTASTLATNATASSEPDALWNEIVRRVRPTPRPLEWATRQPTEEEIEQYHASNIVVVLRGADEARDFYTRFPTHSKVAEAKRKEMEWLGTAQDLGATNGLERLTELRSAVANDPGTDMRTRLQMRWSVLQRDIVKRQPEGIVAVAEGIEEAARTLRKEFPEAQDPYALMNQAVQFYGQARRYDKALAVAQEIAKSDAPEEIREPARRTATRYGYMGKPVGMKFTATDGRTIDLSQWRGRVVLLDFWASWCGPCRASFPEMKKAYEQLHAKGFEVIGINLDEDEGAMNRIISEFKLPWPMWYQGEGLNGKVAAQFGIHGIPSMWLLDKKGVLREMREGVPRDPNVGLGLVEDVTKLLDEQ